MMHTFKGKARAKQANQKPRKLALLYSSIVRIKFVRYSGRWPDLRKTTPISIL